MPRKRTPLLGFFRSRMKMNFAHSGSVPAKNSAVLVRQSLAYRNPQSLVQAIDHIVKHFSRNVGRSCPFRPVNSHATVFVSGAFHV